MLCPFRLNIEYEYDKIGDAVVVSKQKEVYPECYGENCHYYKWDVDKGYYCTQANRLVIDDEEMKE